MVADAGALGYRAAATHGHADALSFTFSVGGREFLVDPGTYAYYTQQAWRRYFRGTAAHNALRIDGLDQSVAALFVATVAMWARHIERPLGRRVRPSEVALRNLPPAPPAPNKEN